MIVLSNGYQLPEDGDLGDIWFDALEANISRLNDHSHNGLDSAKLQSSSIEALSSSVAVGDFTLVGNEYTYLLTLPATMLIDTTLIQCRDAVTRDPVYIKMEQFSITQMTLISNTPLNLIVVFS